MQFIQIIKIKSSHRESTNIKSTHNSFVDGNYKNQGFRRRVKLKEIKSKYKDKKKRCRKLRGVYKKKQKQRILTGNGQ